MEPSPNEALAPWLGRVLEPPMRELEPFIPVLAGHDDAGALWQALGALGHLPAAWLAQRPRFYSPHGMCTACGHVAGRAAPDPSSPCARCGSRARTLDACAHPATPEGCVAAAALGDSLDAADALAREALARLRAWGAAVDGAPSWWVTRDPDARMHTYSPWRALLGSTLSGLPWTGPGALNEREGEVRSALLRGRVDYHTMNHLGADLVDYERLEHLRRGAPDRPEASLPNPFEPLVALWQRGYRLARLASGTVVLIVPDRTPDGLRRRARLWKAQSA